eukprot:1745440-Rhodomonas_salina.1
MLVNFFAGLEALLGDQGSTEAAFHTTARDAVTRAFEHAKAELDALAADVDKQVLLLFENELGTLLDQGAQQAADSCRTSAEGFSYINGTPDSSKVHHQTYFATTRRDGVYKEKDWNQLLSEPVFRPVSVQWEKVFCTSLTEVLAALKVQCSKSLQQVHSAIASELPQDAQVAQRLKVMRTHQERDAQTKLRSMVAVAMEEVNKQQRELSRLVTPHVQETMEPCYHQASKDKGQG